MWGTIWQGIGYHLVTTPFAWGVALCALQLQMRPYLAVGYLRLVLCRTRVTGSLGPADTKGRETFYRRPRTDAKVGETDAKKRVSGFAPTTLEIPTGKRSQNGTEKGGELFAGTPF